MYLPTPSIDSQNIDDIVSKYKITILKKKINLK